MHRLVIMVRKMLQSGRFMATKSILLAVTDPQTLVDINQALGAEWEATSVASEADALAQLEKRSFDALLVDFNLGSPDASDLLNQTLEKRPETIRFLLAYEADLALVAAKVLGSHQILPKPIEPDSLKSRIENGVNDSNSNQSGSDPAKDDGGAPTIPSVYSEVLKALESPDVTNEQVGEIIARDAALMTEVLRLTRSTYMGLPRNLTDPAEAVESLGLETVKALVMALRFLAEHSHLNPGYLSLGQIWQHSTNVAQIARDLVLFETKDRTLASQALAAGLLHDLGKVVLVTNFDDLYGRVHSLARKQPVPLWDIEKEMFGANHGEIGACLVGMWNLPSSIVEAAAFHHEPPLGEHDHLTPLAAVHIANVLEHQLRPSDEYRVAPIINTAFLNELGLLQRLPVWRATSANRGPANRQSHVESAETDQLGSVTPVLESTPSSRTANHLRGPTAATRTTTSGQPSEDSRETVPASPFRQRRWVYAGVAAGVLFLLALWLRTQSSPDESAPVYARTPSTSQAPAVVSSTPPLETVPAATSQVTPATAVSEPAPATNASSVPKPAISQPAPEPSPAIASQATVTNIPPASLPPKESALPDFRLNGIIYTVARPSAILNGETVYVGDQVSGATVVSIRQTDVTLQINGLRRTYTLR
jgi:HD-like signal output (HDOD) protein/ActR/RegA family two-component response regulator